MQHRAYVRSFDGLRALAVLAVIVYHLNREWLPGGFMGVDVFFVISGYLITSILVRTRAKPPEERQGWMLSFWWRRFRRLIPALYLMIIVVTALSVLVDPDVRYQIGQQLFGALTYSSNWVYILVEQSYFEQSVPAIFLHLWSLALEEQFYLVWPVLFVLVFWPMRRPWVRWASMTLLSVASALWMACLYVPGEDPSRVYYGTDTHVFGLLLGASLAVALPLAGEQVALVAARPLWAHNVLATVSLVAVLAMLALLQDEAAFTYRGGLFALSVATMGLLYALLHPGVWLHRVFSWRPAVWLGRRSYGIYLWHWPIIVLLGSGMSWLGRGPVATAMVVVLALALSVVIPAASYRWVERPILRDGLLRYFRRLRRAARVGEFAVTARDRARRSLVMLTAVAVTAMCVMAVVSFPQSTSAQQQIERGLASCADCEDDVDAPDPSPSQTPEPSPSASPTPTVLPGQSGYSGEISGDEVIAVGDSVMIASAPALKEAMPGITIKAKVARQASGTFSAGRKLLKKRSDARLVVVHVGTNGTVKQRDLEKFLDRIGTARGVVLVNVYADRPWEKKNNKLLAAVADERQNVALADWHDAIGKHPKWLAGDEVHPTPKGGATYAEEVMDAAERLGFRVHDE